MNTDETKKMMHFFNNEGKYIKRKGKAIKFPMKVSETATVAPVQKGKVIFWSASGVPLFSIVCKLTALYFGYSTQ